MTHAQYGMLHRMVRPKADSTKDSTMCNRAAPHSLLSQSRAAFGCMLVFGTHGNGPGCGGLLESLEEVTGLRMAVHHRQPAHERMHWTGTVQFGPSVQTLYRSPAH